MRILVVEDDEQLADYLKQGLTEDYYAVDVNEPNLTTYPDDRVGTLTASPT